MSENVPSLRRNELDIVMKVHMYHVMCPLFLSDFSEIWMFSTDFPKTLKYQI